MALPRLPISTSSAPILIAKPLIILFSSLLSAPIVIAVVFILFDDADSESPILPILIVPSLQKDQFLFFKFNSSEFSLEK